MCIWYVRGHSNKKLLSEIPQQVKTMKQQMESSLIFNASCIWYGLKNLMLDAYGMA